MRQGSLFAAFRGKDGNSLAWALMALVLISVFVGGLNSGAAVAGDTTLCLVDDAGGKGPLTAHHHTPDCCILGASPFGTGSAASPPATNHHAAAPAALALAWAEAVAAAPATLTGGATARGPPLEA